MKFKIGNKVKLKNYEEFSDYKEHKNQTAIIVHKLSRVGFNCTIRWNDGSESRAYLNNLIPAMLDLTSRYKELLNEV